MVAWDFLQRRRGRAMTTTVKIRHADIKREWARSALIAQEANDLTMGYKVIHQGWICGIALYNDPRCLGAGGDDKVGSRPVSNPARCFG